MDFVEKIGFEIGELMFSKALFKDFRKSTYIRTFKTTLIPSSLKEAMLLNVLSRCKVKLSGVNGSDKYAETNCSGETAIVSMNETIDLPDMSECKGILDVLKEAYNEDPTNDVVKTGISSVCDYYVPEINIKYFSGSDMISAKQAVVSTIVHEVRHVFQSLEFDVKHEFAKRDESSTDSHYNSYVFNKTELDAQVSEFKSLVECGATPLYAVCYLVMRNRKDYEYKHDSNNIKHFFILKDLLSIDIDIKEFEDMILSWNK